MGPGGGQRRSVGSLAVFRVAWRCIILNNLLVVSLFRHKREGAGVHAVALPGGCRSIAKDMAEVRPRNRVDHLRDGQPPISRGARKRLHGESCGWLGGTAAWQTRGTGARGGGRGVTGCLPSAHHFIIHHPPPTTRHQLLLGTSTRTPPIIIARLLSARSSGS